jgi:hypothetical protein
VKRARGKSGEKESEFADCQDADPRNLILHDQPESRRSCIGHHCPHFKMSAGAALFLETQGLPEHGLGVSMSWGRGTRVPPARPKSGEPGNSERDREGCDTKPLYYRT